jgi:protein arginine N-methyltransferase 1
VIERGSSGERGAGSERLRRAPDLRVRIDSSGQCSISVGGARLSAGPHALAILDAFGVPRTLDEAIALLGGAARGPQEWMALTGEIVALRRAGVLRVEGAGAGEALPATAWAAPEVHVKMLDDRARTEAFLAAIAATVRPGDVVVDVGTGSGVLAVAAARAGARRVYAVESSAIATAAAAVFAANGVADRVTLVEGWSTRVDLPERADVLVSETLGNDPLAEEIVETMRDARRRFLREGARTIPSRVRIVAVPASFDPAVRVRLEFTEPALARWRASYGIDFTPLAAVRRDPCHPILLDPGREPWTPLAEPTMLGEVDFASKDDVAVYARAEVALDRAGRVDGVVVFFDAVLGPEVVLSTRPDRASRGNHWRAPAWMLAEPFDAVAGARVAVRYAYRVAGVKDGAAVAPIASR